MFQHGPSYVPIPLGAQEHALSLTPQRHAHTCCLPPWPQPPPSKPCCHPPARRGRPRAGAPAQNAPQPPPHWPPQRAASRPTASCALSEKQKGGGRNDRSKVEECNRQGAQWTLQNRVPHTLATPGSESSQSMRGSSTSTSQTNQRTCSRLFSPPGNSSYAALAPTRHSPARGARAVGLNLCSCQAQPLLLFHT